VGVRVAAWCSGNMIARRLSHLNASLISAREDVVMNDSQPTKDEFDNAIRAHLERMAALRYADASIYLIYISDRWPPAAETTLSEGPIHDYSGRLSGFPDGHLAVTLEREDGTPPLSTDFQRTKLSDDSRFLLSVTVKDEQVRLTVQGIRLGPYRPEQDPLELQ